MKEKEMDEGKWRRVRWRRGRKSEMTCCFGRKVADLGTYLFAYLARQVWS